MNLRAAYFAVIGPAMVKRASDDKEVPETDDQTYKNIMTDITRDFEAKKIDAEMANGLRRDARRDFLGEDTGFGNYGSVGSKGPSAEDAQALKGGPGFFSNLGSALKGAIMEDVPDAVLSAGRSIAGGFNSMKDGLSEAYKGMQVPGHGKAELEKLDDFISTGNAVRKYHEEQKKKRVPVGPNGRSGMPTDINFENEKTGQAKVWHVMQGWKAGQITTDQIKQLPAHDLEKVANVVYNEARLGDQQAGLLWQLLNG